MIVTWYSPNGGWIRNKSLTVWNDNIMMVWGGELWQNKRHAISKNIIGPT